MGLSFILRVGNVHINKAYFVDMHIPAITSF